MPSFLDSTGEFKSWEIRQRCTIQRRNFVRANRAWGDCHLQLCLLNICERTGYFTTHDLEMNEAFLGAVQNPELRACVLEVIRLQCRMVRFEQKMEAAVAEETRLNNENRAVIEAARNAI